MQSSYTVIIMSVLFAITLNHYINVHVMLYFVIIYHILYIIILYSFQVVRLLNLNIGELDLNPDHV